MAYQIIPVTPFVQNCSLFWCEKSKKAAIIDPGGDTEVIYDAVKSRGLVVEKVLLTHGHLDHVGASADVAAHYQVSIIGPEREDHFWIDQLAMQCQMFGFPMVKEFSPTHWLEHGQMISVGERQLEVRHTPGHTPGHVVFVDHDGKLVIVGDVLFHGSIGRTDFPKGDHGTLINSIQTQLYTLDDDYEFIPGHGPISSIGVEKRTNPHTRA